MTTPPSLCVVPCTISAARQWVARYHSHHGPPVSGLAALGVARGDALVCVALAGRPVARMLAGAAEITRVASVGGDDGRHAASMAVAAMTRALLALGYRRLVSYTLLGEAGTSYRAAGWWPTEVTCGGQWGRTDRPRDPAAQPGRKVRWEYGSGALPRDAEVDARVRAAVGVVVVPPRPAQRGLWS